jgi:ABC-type transport system substrate-binding protein
VHAKMMKNSTRILSAALIALLAGGMVFAFIPAQAAMVYEEGGELKVGIPNAANAPMMTIKPLVTVGNNPISVGARDIIYSLAYQSLASALPNGTYVPLLATSWTISSDGLVYTLKLRDAKWSDGVQFNASDVLFTFQVYNSSVRLDEFAICPYVSQVEILNATAIRYTLKQAFSQWLDYLLTYEWIVPKHEFLTPAGQTGSDGYNISYTIGTGPFQIVNFKPGDNNIHLVRNQYYWGGTPHIQNITAILLNPDANIPGLLQTKQLDLVQLTGGTMVPAIISQPNCTVDIYASQAFEGDQEVGAGVVLFNCLRAPYTDARVRKAIALSIDTKAVVDYALGGYGAVASPGGLPADLTKWVPSDLAPWARDITQARLLLQQAGFVMAADGFYTFANGTQWRPVMTLRARGPSTVIAAIIDQNLKEVGINVQTQVLASGTVVNSWYYGTYEFSILPTNRPTFPDFILNIFRDNPGEVSPIGVYPASDYHGWCRWASAEETDALANAREATTYAAQYQAFADAQRVVADEVPYFTLYYQQTLWARRTDTFEGYETPVSQGFMLPMAGLVMALHLPSHEVAVTPPQDNTVLYVGGAAVIVVVAAALYFLTRKK